MSDQERLVELCYAYALGVLEGEEREDIERRLAGGDSEVEQTLREARGLVANLAYSAEPQNPPAHVKQQLLERVRSETRAAPVQEFPRRRSWAGIAWAAAACLLIAAVFFRQQSADLRGEMTDLRQRYEQLLTQAQADREEAERYRQILAVLSAPDTRAVSLSASNNPRINAYWNDQHGLVLAGDNVPQPAPDRTLQLWVIPKQGAPVSVGLFRPNEQGRAVLIASPSLPLQEASLLAITDEPAPGVEQPTTQPIWVGNLG
jgi:anti-sigma-K factor RskA